MNYQIVRTKDGSKTIRIPELNEHYHSVNGAFTESMHIFIKENFRRINKGEISVLEIGFGTGLNAILTCVESENQGKKVNYHGIERYPLPLETVKELGFDSFLEQKHSELFYKMHEAKWENCVEISDNFFLTKTKVDIKEFLPQKSYDIVYFDAFAPDIQPKLWTKDIFQKIYRASNNEGILTTYSSKGTVRRALKEVGFSVEKIPGPPGKREILRAVK